MFNIIRISDSKKMINIKKIFLILVLSLSFQSLIKANDISDFEIEAMSIGDSALDHFTKKELNNALEILNYKNDEFRYYFLNLINSDIYEYVQITIKPNDRKFIIHGLQGVISYRDNINDCYGQMEKIKKEFNSIFDITGFKDTGKHPMDESGKSTYSRIFYDLGNSGYAEIVCYDMSQETNKGDRFGITLGTREFLDFLTYVEYN